MKSYIHLVLSCILLTACMYPAEQREQLSEVNTHLARIQAQSEQYLQQNKVLPYKYSKEDRKFTTHYLVNFQQLSEVPATAYEKGGNFIYVFVGAEGKQPLVRLFDLRVNNQVEKVQLAVNDYKSRFGKLPTIGKEQGAYYDLDLTKINMSDVSIPSPYFSGASLPMLVDKDGFIYLDYRGDLTQLIQTAKQKPTAGTDLRYWLANTSLFVPAFSTQLKYKDNEVIVTSYSP